MRGRRVFIISNLFAKGHPLKAEPGLSQALDAHKWKLIEKIQSVSDLKTMTEAFVDGIVKEAWVEPLTLHLDAKVRSHYTGIFDGYTLGVAMSEITPAGQEARSAPGLPSWDFLGTVPKQVVRISVPFKGNPILLEYAPDKCGMHLPRGEVSGNRIQFDVMLWGNPEDNERVKQEIQGNLDLIAEYARSNNQQAKRFNDALPPQIKAEFAAKLNQLTQQHAFLDDLGIPEQAEPPQLKPQEHQVEASPVQEVKERSGPVIHITQYIIQHIGQQFVERMKQTNYNEGDVNNAIQSD
jgi:hypothetical protein